MKLDYDTFIYSDPHFGHKNILEYEKRPFLSIENMNMELIENWNRVVHEQSKILVLGDFSLYPKQHKIETTKVLSELKGFKMLILGNHDNKREKYYLDCGFKTVSRYPVLFENIIFSHYPIDVNEPIINIHGHLHSKRLNSPNHICACVEQTNYTPISLKNLELLTRRYDEYKREDFKIIREYKKDWYYKSN